MKMDKIEKFFESRKLRIVIGVFFVLGIVLFIFEAGVLIGYKQASFSYRLDENYNRDFEGMSGSEQILSNLGTPNLPNANGATGSIIKISLPSIIIADKDGVEKTITVTDDTILRQFRSDIDATDLKVGDFVIVIGSPNDVGQIEARLIRVVPSPTNANQPTTSQSTTSPITK